MDDAAEVAALREQVAMLTQQTRALSAAIHALLATVSTPGTAQHLARLLAQNAGETNAPSSSEQAGEPSADIRKSLLAAAERGRISSVVQSPPSRR